MSSGIRCEDLANAGYVTEGEGMAEDEATPRTDAFEEALDKKLEDYGDGQLRLRHTAAAWIRYARELERELAGSIRDRAQLNRDVTGLHNIIAEDRATRPEALTPEGWKLVPAEPTEAMIAAGRDAMLKQPLSDWNPQNVRAYRAMVAASPSPQLEKKA